MVHCHLSGWIVRMEEGRARDLRVYLNNLTALWRIPIVALQLIKASVARQPLSQWKADCLVCHSLSGLLVWTAQESANFLYSSPRASARGASEGGKSKRKRPHMVLVIIDTIVSLKYSKYSSLGAENVLCAFFAWLIYLLCLLLLGTCSLLLALHYSRLKTGYSFCLWLITWPRHSQQHSNHLHHSHLKPC